MAQTIDEKSGFQDPGFLKWKDELLNTGLTDAEISLKIREKILESGGLDSRHDKEFFVDVYDYVKKLIDQHKPLEINLLRIYLEEIKGYDLTESSIIGALMLCAACGLQLVEK